MLGEDGLYLAEFDAQAADLDLLVDASGEHEGSVVATADQIAGLIQPAVAERVGDEPLPGEFRPVEVATGHAGAADVQLADNPGRHRVEPLV